MKSIRFHRILFAVLCLMLIIGYVIAGSWMLHAPEQATAMLEDISGKRNALEGFAAQFDLADSFHTQHILLSDGNISFTTSYQGKKNNKKPFSAPIDGINLVFVPTSDANTKIENGFLPDWQDGTVNTKRANNIQGYIIYTNKVQLYFECVISDKAYLGNVLAPSGLYMTSNQQDICIAYTESVFNSWNAMGKIKTITSYDIYHISCNDIVQDTMLSSTLTSAKVNDNLFFAVPDCLMDYPVTGKTSIYQIDASMTTYESPNPLQIKPYGQISPIITFDAEKASILNLREEHGYLLATIRIEDEIYLYLFSSKGELLDKYLLPEHFPVDTLPSYLHNYDANGDFYLSLLTPGLNPSDAPFNSADMKNALFPSDRYFVVCLKLYDRLTPVFAESCPINPLRQPVALAWRNHKLLCIQQEFPDCNGNSNGIFQKQLYIEVRSAENQCLYAGKLLTDAPEDLRTHIDPNLQRHFRRINLLDDPAEKEHTNYVLSNYPLSY